MKSTSRSTYIPDLLSGYVAGKFVRENWQWPAGSPVILGLLGWLISRLRKPKEHKAGF
jgi:hypothetical protein